MRFFVRASRSPIFLVCLAAGLIAFVVQSGELGTADTTFRLQTTHSWWTSTPPVSAGDYPDFGVRGRGGKIQSWYGIGQSLLMLPTDLLGTAVNNLPLFSHYKDTDPSPRDIVITFLTQMFVTVLTALVCFRFLRRLGFVVRDSVAGVLVLLVATTHLHYTQNMMENNYIFLLTLIGFSYQFAWLQTGNKRALLIGSAGFGLNLLTRLTTGLDLLAGGLFVLLAVWFDGVRGRALWLRCRDYCAVAVPVYLFFGFLDRLYQFYRFGSFTNTYVGLVKIETLARHPDWPKNYPFETPFHVGFVGALFTPEKSIFLFDPLLILLILLAALHWKRFTPAVRAYIVASAAMLMAYICFYARYTVWSGDFAWGDRYVSTSAEFVAMLAIPLLLRYRADVGRVMWITGIVLLAISTAVQLVSLAFWLPLEIYQMMTFGHPTFVIALRVKNIVAFALGKMDAWGLNTDDMTYDPWDFAHITAWNFLPFLLKRVGVAPPWAVRLAFAVWYAGLAALGVTLLRLRFVLKKPVALDALP